MKADHITQNWSATGTIDTGRYPGAGAQSVTGWTLFGIALVAGYAVLVITGWRWGWLATLQELEWYEILTGLALTLVFAEQWRLAGARMEGATGRANRLLTSHKKWGALVPLPLYLHADHLGHGYVRALCLAFVGLVCLGLVHPSIVRFNRAWLTTSWLVMHVALAAMLIYLIGYHAFDAFYYE